MDDKNKTFLVVAFVVVVVLFLIFGPVKYQTTIFVSMTMSSIGYFSSSVSFV